MRHFYKGETYLGSADGDDFDFVSKKSKMGKLRAKGKKAKEGKSLLAKADTVVTTANVMPIKALEAIAASDDFPMNFLVQHYLDTAVYPNFQSEVSSAINTKGNTT